MIYAHAVTKNAPQPFRQLCGQNNLRQHEEYLLTLPDSFLHEVDVYFRLAAARYAMQEADVVRQPLIFDVVHRPLLDVAQRYSLTHVPLLRGQLWLLDRLVLAAAAELFLHAHGTLLQEALHDWKDRLQSSCFLQAGQSLPDIFARALTGKCLPNLFLARCQRSLGFPVFIRKNRALAFQLKSRGKCSLKDIADGAKIVVADPLPEP